MSASKPLRLRILEAMLSEAVEARRNADREADPIQVRLLSRRVRIIQRDVDAERDAHA